MRKILVLAAALGLTGCGSMAFLSSPPPVFVVFFDGTSTDVTPTGHKIIDDVAAAAHAHPEKIVQLTGPNTKVASGNTPGLAEPRIHAVELALGVDGVSPERMMRASETTDGVNVQTDPSGGQRVEIRLVDAPAK
jgi:hypothetical protein